MNNTELKARLINAATEYDRKQVGKRGYNRFALPQYLARVDAVCEAIAEGADVQTELGRGFNGRLLTCLAKAVGVEAKEQGNFSY